MMDDLPVRNRVGCFSPELEEFMALCWVGLPDCELMVSALAAAHGPWCHASVQGLILAIEV